MLLLFLANTYNQRECDSLDLWHLIFTQLFVDLYLSPHWEISAVISLNKFSIPFPSLFGGFYRHYCWHRSLRLFIFFSLFPLYYWDEVNYTYLSSNSTDSPLSPARYHWGHWASFSSQLQYFLVLFNSIQFFFYNFCFFIKISWFFISFKGIHNCLLKHLSMAALKSLSDYSSTSFVLVLACVDCLFSLRLWFSWFLVWRVIFKYILVILEIILWDYGSQSFWAGHPPLDV